MEHYHWLFIGLAFLAGWFVRTQFLCEQPIRWQDVIGKKVIQSITTDRKYAMIDGYFIILPDNMPHAQAGDSMMVRCEIRCNVIEFKAKQHIFVFDLFRKGRTDSITCGKDFFM